MKLDPVFSHASRQLTSFALHPSLGVRFSDLHLRLRLAYDRALSLRQIGGAHHRRTRIASLRLARVVTEARHALAHTEGRAA